MKIYQSAQLSRDPQLPMEVVTKQYVDAQIAASSGAAVVGGLFFLNVSPTSGGNVGDKQYVQGTTPANKVISSATTDSDNVTVSLFAEGGSAFYSPTITITTVPAQAGGPIVATLTEDANDKRAYTATANIVVSENTVVTATSTTNATTTCSIVRAEAGPVVDVLSFGSLPGSQTELKAGDTITVTGRVQNTATYAEIVAGGAAGALAVMAVGAVDSFSTGYKTITATVTIGAATGLQTVQARARNALGTFGANFTTTNSVTLNQTYPTIGARTITYPNGQQALKGTDTATVAATVTNQNTISYTATNMSVANPTTYAASKTVTRTNGTYSYGVNNYTITATKTSNGAVTTAQSAVTIANSAPTAAITITGNPARLQSSAAGVDYVVTITADQRLLSAPSVTASSGTWQGAGWVGSGAAWTRTLRIIDSDPKGTQTFSNLSLTGLAGVTGSVISTGSGYTVGGFATRTITFPAFARFAPIGTSVVDITKVTALYTGAAALLRRTDTDDVFGSFTIVDSNGNYSPTGDHLFISDAAFAGSNTTGTLKLDVTEAV